MATNDNALSRRTVLHMGGAAGAALLLGMTADVRVAAAAPISLEKRPELVAGKFGPMSCAQALATTYADLVGLKEAQAKNLAAGFGLGMGKKQTCGALTVALMLCGLAGKEDQCEALMDAFEKQMDSTQCAFFVDQYGFGRCRDLLRFTARELNTRVFG